jgi:hypothetical protein
MILNSGQSFTTTIPQDGIIVIDTSTITQPTDILHVDISGGGTLRGIMLTENGTDQLDPGDPARYTTFTISAPIDADPQESVTIAHMDQNVPAGQRIFCPWFRSDTVIDEHDHFCRFVWHTSEWVVKVNAWTAAP